MAHIRSQLFPLWKELDVPLIQRSQFWLMCAEAAPSYLNLAILTEEWERLLQLQKSRVKKQRKEETERMRKWSRDLLMKELR